MVRCSNAADTRQWQKAALFAALRQMQKFWMDHAKELQQAMQTAEKSKAQLTPIQSNEAAAGGDEHDADAADADAAGVEPSSALMRTKNYAGLGLWPRAWNLKIET